MIRAVLGAFIIVVLGFWFRWRKNKLSVFRKLGIPGPEPSIFFGNMWEIYTKDINVCHEEWTQRYGKVLGYYHGLEPMMLISDVDLINMVQIKMFKYFTARPMHLFFILPEGRSSPRTFAKLEGQPWKHSRDLLSPAYTTTKLKNMIPEMSSVSQVFHDMLDEYCESEKELDVGNFFKRYAGDMTGRVSFGVELPDRDDPDNALLRNISPFLNTPFKIFTIPLYYSFPELRFMFHPLHIIYTIVVNNGIRPELELKRYSEKVIRLRRSDPSLRRPDVLQIMLDLEENSDDMNLDLGHMSARLEQSDLKPVETTDIPSITKFKADNCKIQANKDSAHLMKEQITGNTMGIFVAGLHSLSNVLTMITNVLANMPDVQEKLRAEIVRTIKDNEVTYENLQCLHFMDRFIKEVIRMHTFNHSFISRVCSEEVQLNNWCIPKDMNLIIPSHILHHSPEFWHEPEIFDPDRFLPENLSSHHSAIYQGFGNGPRHCIGLRLSNFAMKFTLAKLLGKYQIEAGPHTKQMHQLEYVFTSVEKLIKSPIFVKVRRLSS